MFLVRIKPHLPVDSYNQFFKKKGWHQVDEATAKWCASRRLNDLNPAAELVFDVMTPAEAKVVSTEEQKREDPAGTAEQPVVMTGIGGAQDGEAKGTDDSGAAAGVAGDDSGARPKLRR